jgi:hypothetical protein
MEKESNVIFKFETVHHSKLATLIESENTSTDHCLA